MWKNLFIGTVATYFTTNEQLKYLTICFVFESSVTNYLKKICFLMFSHSNTCVILGWTPKTLNLKNKTYFFGKKIHVYSLVHLILCFPTHLPT
jgi:hypothetical protein